MGLTKKEEEIAYYAKQGFSKHEIAQKLAISSETVKRRLSDIKKKLNITCVSELCNFDFKNPDAPIKTEAITSGEQQILLHDSEEKYFVQMFYNEDENIYLKVRGNLDNFKRNFADFVSKRNEFREFLLNYDLFKSFLSYKDEFWDWKSKQKKIELPKELF